MTNLRRFRIAWRFTNASWRLQTGDPADREECTWRYLYHGEERPSILTARRRLLPVPGNPVRPTPAGFAEAWRRAYAATRNEI